MRKRINQEKITLAILMAAALGLTGCGGSSSGGGGGDDPGAGGDDPDAGGGDPGEDIGGSDSGDPVAQELEIDREDAVAFLARATADDIRGELKSGQPIFVKGFSENFESPFGNRLPRNEECGDAFNAIEDTAKTFDAEFSECKFTFLNGIEYRIDGDFTVSHGPGGENTASGLHDFSYEVEAENLEFMYLSEVEDIFGFGFTAYSWNGDARLDYTEVEDFASPDWKLAIERFEMDLEHECPARLGSDIEGAMVGFNLGVDSLSATTAPSAMGTPRSDVTLSGQLIIAEMDEGFDGTYDFETTQPIVLANDPANPSNSPESGTMSITGPDGFAITVEYEESGYYVTGGVVDNRYAPSLSAVAADPTGIDSDAIPNSVTDTVCELQGASS